MPHADDKRAFASREGKKESAGEEGRGKGEMEGREGMEAQGRPEVALRLSTMGIAERVRDVLYATTDVWVGWEKSAGPVVNLLGLTVCVLSLFVFRQNIYWLSCKYSVSYSPSNGIFAIWGIIFLASGFSIVQQMLYDANPSTFYVAKFETNALIACAWVCSGAWCGFFRVVHSSAQSAVLGVAASLLVAASGCGVAAEATEGAFLANSTAPRVLFVGVPNSIFSGWLVVAASVGIGIFVNSTLDATDDDLRCEPKNGMGRRGRRRGFVAPDARSCVERYAPLMVSVPVAVFAGLRRNFVFPLPLLAALLAMRRDWVKVASMAVAGAGAATGAAVFVSERT